MKAHARIARQVTPPALHHVAVNDTFWSSKIDVNRRTTIPFIYKQCLKTGRIDAFRLNQKQTHKNKPHFFWDSDVAKWLEAAAYSLASENDIKLEKTLDGVIALIAAAQQPDGYLNTYFTAIEP